MGDKVDFLLNGEAKKYIINGDDTTLLSLLRDEFNLKATKYGCGMGQCGSCKVLVDGKAVNSCQISTWDLNKKSVVTLEGLQQDAVFLKLKESFFKENAAQCGICISGMLISCYSILNKKIKIDKESVSKELQENLCRCGIHHKIIKAMLKVSM
jgi:aerobic-type carbon monoxide dehydrogenase small subunit (CoxS/CutS family)